MVILHPFLNRKEEQMAELLVPNDGVRGADIESESGVKKYDADKRGVISVENPAHVRQLVSEGFTRRGVSLAVGKSRFKTWACQCGKLSFEYQINCVHCKADREISEIKDQDGNSD
jgi:hypothetical protein